MVWDNNKIWLGKKPRLVAVTHVSNVLGTINPIQQIVELAHRLDVPVLVDGAQAVPHQKVDVQELGCDFYAFSAHKMYGPTGVGVLYAKQPWLEVLPPYQSGGDMIRRVSFSGTEFAEPPYKFEAGTPNIAGVLGLGAAIDFLQGVGFEAIHRQENELMHHAEQVLYEFPGVRILGQPAKKHPVISFVFQDVHAHDVATILDSQGIAVRAGHHCAMPLLEWYKVPATVRVSLGMYNDLQDIERLFAGLKKVQTVFA